MRHDHLLRRGAYQRRLQLVDLVDDGGFVDLLAIGKLLGKLAQAAGEGEAVRACRLSSGDGILTKLITQGASEAVGEVDAGGDTGTRQEGWRVGGRMTKAAASTDAAATAARYGTDRCDDAVGQTAGMTLVVVVYG
jgi:hypothetical protein